MARYTGNDGVVNVGANAVANVRRFEYNEEGDEIEVPAMGDSARVRLPGKPNVGGTILAWYDDTDTTGQGALVQGAEISLELRPRGSGSGLPQHLMAQARITTVSERTEVDQGIEVEFGFVSDTKSDKTAQV